MDDPYNVALICQIYQIL